MKKQLLTAFLLTTSIATVTENYATTSAERLAALKQQAEQRQTGVERKTANIRRHAETVAAARQEIDRDTSALEGDLIVIDKKMDPLAILAGQGEAAIEQHAAALTAIKNDTARLATEAQRIAASLDQTITDKTTALEAAIRAGDADIASRQDALRELTAVHATITGQIRSLTAAVDTINNLLDPTAG